MFSLACVEPGFSSGTPPCSGHLLQLAASGGTWLWGDAGAVHHRPWLPCVPKPLDPANSSRISYPSPLWPGQPPGHIPPHGPRLCDSYPEALVTGVDAQATRTVAENATLSGGGLCISYPWHPTDGTFSLLFRPSLLPAACGWENM